ncbi:DUF4355 domain-containing protein [Paenarthrobacter sp. NPDC018779]|uniref:capsid assembly scaffolding protein Gp46 family protein n=1 Tax=Paenarthrobacter sp. NPDC018779 TaxID=3364375 RepID=UPI0037C96E9A
MSEATTTEATATTEAEPTTTQELGDGGIKALQAERDARKAAEKANADLAAKLKAFEDAKLSDLEKAQNAANESAAELAKLRSENIRNTVALSKGVPADLVEFLTGDTEEAVAAKADLLLARLNAPTSPRPDPSQGPKGDPALGSDPLLDALKNKLGIQ